MLKHARIAVNSYAFFVTWKGTSEIQTIVLDFPKYEKTVQWDGKAFQKMTGLQTLIIRSPCFAEGPKNLPNSLRVLEWWGYPSQSLPSYFYPKKLAVLKLPRSSFMSLELSKSKASYRTCSFSRSYI